MAITLPSFTRAGLPNAPTAGDLARVTDSVQGAWIADGTTLSSWFSLIGEVVNVRDFGATGDGTTDDRSAIQQAINAASGTVYVPPGTYACSGEITLKPQLTILGAGYLNSIIKFTGATRGFVYAPVQLTEAQIRLSGLRIMGTVASALELVYVKNATNLYFDQLNIRDTSRVCLYAEQCHVTFMNQLRIENASLYGIHLKSTANVWSILGCDFQGNAISSVAALYIEACGFGGVRDSNFEGSTAVAHAIRLNAAADVEIAANFMEFYSDSAIDFRGGASNRIRIALNHIHSSQVAGLVDASSSMLTHEGLIVEQNRFNGVNGSNCFNPGATTSYAYRMNFRGFTGTDVIGFTESEVEKVPGPIRQKEARLLNEGIISGSTPSVHNLQYVEVQNGSPVTMTNLTGGARDQLLILRFEDNNTTVQSGGAILLAGKVNKTFAALDTLTLLNVNGATWVEVCRSIN
jgi:hypothetical protein